MIKYSRHTNSIDKLLRVFIIIMCQNISDFISEFYLHHYHYMVGYFSADTLSIKRTTNVTTILKDCNFPYRRVKWAKKGYYGYFIAMFNSMINY